MTNAPTPELLVDMRNRVALWRQTSLTVGHVTPDEVVALLDKIDELERVVAAQAWDRSRVE